MSVKLKYFSLGIYLDLQLKPYRTDEYVHKLYYETSKFSAFNHQWVVKATINNSQRDVHEANERQIAYQLILKTKTTCPLAINFFVLKGPFSDMKVNTKIYKHDFSDAVSKTIKCYVKGGGGYENGYKDYPLFRLFVYKNK